MFWYTKTIAPGFFGKKQTPRVPKKPYNYLKIKQINLHF